MHRIGQNNDVVVTRFTIANTVEQQMLEMQVRVMSGLDDRFRILGFVIAAMRLYYTSLFIFFLLKDNYPFLVENLRKRRKKLRRTPWLVEAGKTRMKGA